MLKQFSKEELLGKPPSESQRAEMKVSIFPIYRKSARFRLARSADCQMCLALFLSISTGNSKSASRQSPYAKAFRSATWLASYSARKSKLPKCWREGMDCGYRPCHNTRWRAEVRTGTPECREADHLLRRCLLETA